MVNYITSVGVQYYSITIASGSATGTATITAVGSGAFILHDGINPSASANTGEQQARVTLTNSTTITATRATLTAGTVVVKGCIIDADTTNLIKSVQYGTILISLASTSGTASISAVTDGNTAVEYLGFSIVITAVSERQNLARLSLSGTTVTATMASAAPSDLTVGFEIIEFQTAALSSAAVQRISCTSSASVTSYDVAIPSAIVMNNALCIYSGSSIGTDTTTLSQGEMYGNLKDTTTFTTNINGATTDAKAFNVSIIDFASGVLNQAMQRGTTTLTGATSNTSAITSVVTGNSIVSYLNQSTSAGIVGVDRAKCAVVLTDSTTITVTKTTATDNATGSWEVAEFPAFSSGGFTPVNRRTIGPRVGSRSFYG